ncbi:MAG: hypothetical protein NTZ39_12145, partial [Methanoregula sp.]|nr:hypothetical protein [Methanoregula sp.]
CMVQKPVNGKTVCVVGLGYVGQPLAEDVSWHIRTIGNRRDQKKNDELNATTSCIANNINFPYVHDLAALITVLLTHNISVPDSVLESAKLTRFAINDSMPEYVAEMAVKGLNKVGKTIKGSNILIMGLKYKEDVADIRESPVEKMVHELKEYDVDVYGYDPLLPESVIVNFGAKPLPKLDKKRDAVIIAVVHKQFKEMTVQDIRGLMNDHPVLIDMRHIPGEASLPHGWLMNDHPVLIDMRGMIDKVAAERSGMSYRKLQGVLALMYNSLARERFDISSLRYKNNTYTIFDSIIENIA